MDESRSLLGCAFCMTTLTDHEVDQFGTARTWGKDDLVNLPICPTCALQHQQLLPQRAIDRIASPVTTVASSSTVWQRSRAFAFRSAISKGLCG